MAYIIYCDESSDKGPKYCDFFGGCMINSENEYELITSLEKKKAELNLQHEIKWTRVTENYLDKYIEMIDLFFDYVEAGLIKVRIMFRDKDDNPSDSSKNSVDDKYFKLYYQFLKHAFGLKTIPNDCTPTNIIIFLDVLPDKHGKSAEFKEYLNQMPLSSDFASSNIQIRSRDIIEIDSKEHVLLQCTDIVLGAMYFRLNGFHKAKPEGSRYRGKRTIAKEKLYKHIYKRISRIHPCFNIGESTGSRNFQNPHWESPYEHWLFKAK